MHSVHNPLDQVRKTLIEISSGEKPIDFSEYRKHLQEARKHEFKDKLIEVNLALVKEQIAQSVNIDVLVVQAVNSIEDLDRILNSMTKRLREWYSYYFPELSEKILDNELFINRMLEKSKDEYVKEFNVKQSMGGTLREVDVEVITTLARQVNDLFIERQKIMAYLEVVVKENYSNMNALAGTMITAKLLQKAGSLKHLAMMPSSTIQLLGAEKALFRHLRNKKLRPPKHGLILSHPLVMSAKRFRRGMAARMMAGKLSIAAKVDYFHGEFIGDELKLGLEKKLA